MGVVGPQVTSLELQILTVSAIFCKPDVLIFVIFTIHKD
jgi:hypothetical protein